MEMCCSVVFKLFWLNLFIEQLLSFIWSQNSTNFHNLKQFFYTYSLNTDSLNPVKV